MHEEDRINILERNLLIHASAGSGKTYQLGNRVIGLVAQGNSPEKIVALTFTRKAAGEFADSVLTKLAKAASDYRLAAELENRIGLKPIDFNQVLGRVVQALPTFNLSTIDSFFAKIVRGFQYEFGITGGKFDLVEGPRATALADEIISSVLNRKLDDSKQDREFLHAFRRATMGRESQSVLSSLREFVATWHEEYRNTNDQEWGPLALEQADVDDWEKEKHALAQAALDGIHTLTFTHKSQESALQASIETLRNHTIGSGSLGKSTLNSLTKNLLEAVVTQTPPLEVKCHKNLILDGTTGNALHKMVMLAAQCELTAALRRTRAIRDVVQTYDSLCDSQLRKKGLLGFSDVKHLMGAWSRYEQARLKRDAVDFRIDARYDHWLLDEFQDTSRADWNGLSPLINEAVSDEHSKSFFLVGDRKQAIYGWRGGDVNLFDEVRANYEGGIATAPMYESFRSCPQVLELVNTVCGDIHTIQSLFGNPTPAWQWDEHFSADHLKADKMRGHARVEIVEDEEHELSRLVEVLNDLEIGKRQMTCGILLRSNDHVTKVAEYLRSHHFDVIEEGRRKPATDNQPGIVITHLLQWLANPSSHFARGVLEMSPIAPVLRDMHGNEWKTIWEKITREISAVGFSRSIAPIIAPVALLWSEFGRRRANDLLTALADFDATGCYSARQAADWITRLEIVQSPGVAAVQVMTIHKSKGLGFDVVLLPHVPDDITPATQKFDVARGDRWISETPPGWVRNIMPEMRDAEQRWAASQRYEAICMLYVALTRAKRGLYVILKKPGKNSNPDKSSLANWIIRSAGQNPRSEEIIFESGSSDWVQLVDQLPVAEAQPACTQLTPPTQKLTSLTPSTAKNKNKASTHSPTGMKFGSEVHCLMEQIGWIDETPAQLPPSDAGKAVARLIKSPAVAMLFKRENKSIDLYREQATDAFMDGQLMSGIIDRLHIHRESAGSVTRVEIIYYKTDAVASSRDLVDRYSGQMQAYQLTLQKIYPNAEVVPILISVKHAELIYL